MLYLNPSQLEHPLEALSTRLCPSQELSPTLRLRCHHMLVRANLVRLCVSTMTHTTSHVISTMRKRYSATANTPPPRLLAVPSWFDIPCLLLLITHTTPVPPTVTVPTLSTLIHTRPRGPPKNSLAFPLLNRECDHPVWLPWLSHKDMQWSVANPECFVFEFRFPTL